MGGIKKKFVRTYLIPILSAAIAIAFWKAFGNGDHYWWLILIIAVTIGHYYFYYRQKKRVDEKAK